MGYEPSSLISLFIITIVINNGVELGIVLIFNFFFYTLGNYY